jgi:hypothetical protein
MSATTTGCEVDEGTGQVSGGCGHGWFITSAQPDKAFIDSTTTSKLGYGTTVLHACA